MAEIKRTFTAGKMNKDLDERLVPNGEYRDGRNIQIRTTEDGAAGTVQDLLGSEAMGNVYSTLTTNLETHGQTRCVGVVADERRDRAYFLFAAPELNFSTFQKNVLTFWVDTIIEQDASGLFRPVVVDLWGVTETRELALSGNNLQSAPWTSLNVEDASKYRVGMNLEGFTNAGVSIFEPDTVVTKITGNTVHFNKSNTEAVTADCICLMWTHPKALGFNNKSHVTGINVVDDFLFYTTGFNEPKKINIRRCKSGTVNPQIATLPSHTKVKIDSTTGILQGVEGNVTESPYDNTGDLKSEHITVIRKSPRVAPTISMKSTATEGGTDFVIDSQVFSSNSIGDSVVINMPNGLAITDGDKVKLTCLNDSNDVASSITAQVEFTFNQGGNLTLFNILSISTDILASHTNWLVELIIEGTPLFELKFPKFGFRYKYNDGEYSSFSPWSQVAFLPGEFDYKPKKGYNLGMTNTARSIIITNLLADHRIRPDDIKCIDILYKSTDSPTVYLVRTIEKNVDPEWSTVFPNSLDDTSLSEVIINSEIIHRVIESNQSLRVWDNVPRAAKAQEMVSSRLIYGNYTQGYNLSFNVAIDQSLSYSTISSILTPEKSLKSLRTYKFGAVYGDIHGRETPVIVSGTRQESTLQSIISESSDSTIIPKSSAILSSSFSLTQRWGSSGSVNNSPDSWMDYVKYYVKETSGEYYNLVTDRWYDASDGNIWISFASSERNKVDEETYLILKNEHGSNNFVEEEGRYKIISIANEAPEFIKTESRSIGERLLDVDTNVASDIEELTTRKQFNLPYGTYGNFFSDSEFKGTLKVRIKASTPFGDVFTSFKTVTRLKRPGETEEEDGSLQIIETFGSEAILGQALVDQELYSTLKAALAGITYNFDFIDEVVKNKPEFDGRFFVKIERDLLLEQKVLKAIASSSSYSIIASHNIAYVDTSAFTNLAATGVYKDYQWFNPVPSGYSDFFNNSNNIDNHFAHINSNTTNTSIFWGNYTSQTQLKQNVIAFIDNARSSFQTDGNNEFLSENEIHKRGLAKSGDAGIDSTTFDRLYLSAFTDGGENNAFDQFKTDMQSIGTIFQFAADPNDNVAYMIVSGNDSQFLYNDYNANGNGSSFGINPTREVFYTTFKRIGTNGQLLLEGVDVNDWDPRGAVKQDGTNSFVINILEKNFSEQTFENSSSNGAVWETEPKETADLDVYYEASSCIPLKLNVNNTVEYAPIGSKVTASRFGVDGIADLEVKSVHDGIVQIINAATGADYTSLVVNDVLTFTHADGTKTRSKVKGFATASNLAQGSYVAASPIVAFKGSVLTGQLSRLYVNNEGDEDAIVDGMTVERFDGEPTNLASSTTIITTALGSYFPLSNNATATSSNITYKAFASGTTESTGYYLIDKDVFKYKVDLPWFNCYSFGNGVESDRIRDDFNSPRIGKGEKASTTFLDYKEQIRSNGLIYSGIYNANSSFNALNEFNMAEKITKDISPSYGSIQALKTRDTDITVFTEDKVLRVLANKDALFNADGSTNILSSNKVLGQATPYAGDYGISKDPESLACDQYRMYFTDKQRGAVLRLSRDGITPISNVGMKSFFRSTLPNCKSLVGSFDVINGEYNLTMKSSESIDGGLSFRSISFNESSKGWVSFKSFFPNVGVSVSGTYYTAFTNKTWKHYSDNVARNSFHGMSGNNASDIPSITLIFNEASGSVKNFKAINYEGSAGFKSTVNNSNGYSDGNFSTVDHNSTAISTEEGWSVSSITTDLTKGGIESFSQKEGKWYSNIIGSFAVSNNLVNTEVDFSDFSTQGLGIPLTVTHSSGTGATYTIIIEIE